MVRHLYRAYLYSVCVILLIIATTTTGVSLSLLLTATSLRGPYGSPPGRTQLVQALVALVVVWLVTLLLGGLHYWLIRRDMASDSAAGGGAVRSFFLNVTQMFAALFAIGFATAGIASLENQYNAPIGFFSTALATGGLFVLLQLERMRTHVATPRALTLQRLHLYGAQLGIVLIAAPFWSRATETSVLYTLTRIGAFDPCVYYYAGSFCSQTAYYHPRQVVAEWAAAFFIAACWAGYTAFTRHDYRSRLRQVAHLLALGYAVAFALSGAQRIIYAALLKAVGHPLPNGQLAQSTGTALGPLVFGIVAFLAYRWLSAREAPSLPSGMPAATYIQWALYAIICAFPFWVGIQSLLSAVVERVVPAGTHADAVTFAQAGSQVVTGLPFVVLALFLGMGARQSGVSWPHRIFVLVLLAGGVIDGATGMVFALQAFGSTVLGAPPSEWQHAVRTGLVMLLVGGTMVGIFLTVAARNHYLGARHEPKPDEARLISADTQPVMTPDGAAGVAVSESEPLEAILDALLAGRVTRDEAAARIRAREGIH